MKRLMTAAGLLLFVLFLMPFFPAQAAQNKIAIDQNVKTLFEDETLQLSLTLSGDCENGTITWESGNERIASVDENGLVTGLRKGQSVITAICRMEKKTMRATITLTVQRKVTDITVQERRLTVLSRDDALLEGLLQMDSDLPVLVINTGNSVWLDISAEPDSASNRRVTVTSSDTDVVRISEHTLNPRKTGECIVTLTSQLNPEVQKAYHVLVVQKVTGIKVSAEEKTTYVGGSIQMTAKVNPDTATIQDVIWKSENEKVATVDAHGLVTGHRRGQADITATAVDGSNRRGTFTVTVRQQAERIELNSYEETIAVGYNKTIRATVLPENANNKEVVWESSDTTVAKVNNNGYITPVRAGECEITARAKTDAAVFATARIRITQPVTKISFSDRELSVKVGETLQLRWFVEPADVTDPTLTFSSNNEKAAVVDSRGLVTGRARGDLTITAKATDGSNRYGRITIHVIQPVLGVHMQNDTIRVGVDEYYTLSAVMEPENANNRNMSWTIADEYFATIRGSNNRPVVTGRHWGTTTAHGITEDGGYEVDCTIQVGNYDKALKITDLYLQDNAVKIVVKNQSNMTVTRFYGQITCYDIYGQPLPCTTTGVNAFECAYGETMYEDDITRHGRFSFYGYQQPVEQIGRVTMCITGYVTDTGYSRNIREDRWDIVEFTAANYIGYVPVPDPTAEPAPY